MSKIFEDVNVEESMIKSCLLFSNRALKSKSNTLLQKYILSILMSGNSRTVNDICNYLKRNNKESIANSGKVEACLTDLCSNGFVTREGDEYVIPIEKSEESEKYMQEIKNKQEKLLDDIVKKVQMYYKKHITNLPQVRINVKKCIDYYYTVSGISFLDLDEKKDVQDLDRLNEIASYDLPKGDREELKDIIICTIGDILESPSVSQMEILEQLAKIYVSSQVMNIDPVLNNFKTTIIRDKVFILDTEVVLFAITDETRYSKQYKAMLKQLVKCGCKIYVPKVIIEEVYDHAEAAKKRYTFISHMLDTDSSLVASQLKNIFIEDFYNKRRNGNQKLSWKNYLANYYNADYGFSFTEEQVKFRLGEGINYSQMPNVKIPDEERWLLESEALKSTEQTEKAQYREDAKNDVIAKNDAMLYLSAKFLNKENQEREGTADNNRQDLMHHKYYVLSHLTRIHKCALNLNIASNVLCKPLVLITYLAETGILSQNVEIQSLFDNPFIMCAAKVAWTDIEKLLNTGVDVRDKNLITLRYELQNEINEYLSSPNDDGYKQFVEIASEKGMKFTEPINELLEEKRITESQLMEVKKQVIEQEKKIQEMRRIIDEKDERLQAASNENRKKQYEIRVAGKKIKNNNKRRKK